MMDSELCTLSAARRTDVTTRVAVRARRAREGQAMSIRTTTSTIRFSRPFAIAGVADEQPPGSYTLEIDEELLQNVSFPAYRRISTMIRLPPRPDSTELERVVYLDPLELAELLASDAKIEDKAVTTPSAATTE